MQRLRSVSATNLVTHHSRKLYYYVRIVVASGGQLDKTKSNGGYGSIPLNF